MLILLSPGFAFATFKNKTSAQEAIKKISLQLTEKKEVNVHACMFLLCDVLHGTTCTLYYFVYEAINYMYYNVLCIYRI